MVTMKKVTYSPLVQKARRLADMAHGAIGQKHGDEFSYIVHPTLVESVLLRFGDTDEIRRASAYTHDVFEDTPITYEELETILGSRVAEVVAALTEPKGGNRKWRHEQTYPRIAKNRDAIIVKLADRIANVEAGGKKVQMYVKEHKTFKEALRNSEVIKESDSLVNEMWEYLDSLIIDLMPKPYICPICNPWG